VLLLDTNAIYWWVAEPHMLSNSASLAIADADEISISAISWFELAWMVEHARVAIDVPLSTWFDRIAGQVNTLSISPAIAMSAVRLPDSFPGDPMDRVIYSTAIEHGLQLVTSDRFMRSHPYPRQITIW
jgi:PIN domain nuclease of toxin-antitoxin system